MTWFTRILKRFDPDQPRAPAGTPNGGQWVDANRLSLGIDVTPSPMPADLQASDSWAPEDGWTERPRQDFEAVTSEVEFEAALKHYDAAPFQFGERTLYVVDGFRGESADEKEPHVVSWDTDFKFAEVQTGVTFVSQADLDEYEPNRDADFNDEFWSVSHPAPLYHRTSPENVASILEGGLQPMRDSRGYNNSHIGEAVFTNDDPDAIAGYGKAVFEIDVRAMQRDGFRVEVMREPGVVDDEARGRLAEAVGLDPYGFATSDPGELYNTVIFMGAIPPKYLELVE